MDWSPITAASAQSAIAALLAGFVFTGTIVVLSVPSRRRHREAAQALKMLLTAFFGLAVTAYLLADMAGEQACLRAETTEALAGGSLGAFAIIMVVAVTWLVAAYGNLENEVLGYLHTLVYIGSSFVILLLCTSSVTYLSADMPKVSNNAIDILTYAAGGLAILGGGVWIWRFKNVAPARAVPSHQEQVSITSDRAVNVSIAVALAYLTISSLATGIAASFPGQDWYPSPARWVVYLVAESSFLLPLLVLIFVVNAIARTGDAVTPVRSASRHRDAHPGPNAASGYVCPGDDPA